MFTHRSLALVPACCLALSAGAVFADSRADRMDDSARTQQASDPVEEIHQTYGPTAAGPGQQQADWEGGDNVSPERHDFPDGIDTAHERFRYIFESNEF